MTISFKESWSLFPAVKQLSYKKLILSN
jgi:hypothetical protein